jgi:flagellar hook-length control protein FliK
MSLLQLLAKSLEADDSAAPSTDSSATAVTDKPSDDSNRTAAADPNGLALAMFTQAFAAALGASTAASPEAASNASVAAADSASGSVTDVTKSPSGSSMQDLVSLLAQRMAADGKGKPDTHAAQFDVAATKDSSSDTGTAGTGAAAGPDSLAQSVAAQSVAAQSVAAQSAAHLGVASHFSLQHTQYDTHSGELKSALGSAAWNDEVGGQLTWMTQKGLESGSLRVSPEHLGPVEVQISVQNGDASVWFGAHHPDTRAALEQALPRLREMFANQGLTLTDSGVSRESPRNQSRSPSPQSVAAVSAIGSSDVSASSAVRSSPGLVDTYA